MPYSVRHALDAPVTLCRMAYPSFTTVGRWQSPASQLTDRWVMRGGMASMMSQAYLTGELTENIIYWLNNITTNQPSYYVMLT